MQVIDIIVNIFNNFVLPHHFESTQSFDKNDRLFSGNVYQTSPIVYSS